METWERGNTMNAACSTQSATLIKDSQTIVCPSHSSSVFRLMQWEHPLITKESLLGKNCNHGYGWCATTCDAAGAAEEHKEDPPPLVHVITACRAWFLNSGIPECCRMSSPAILSLSLACFYFLWRFGPLFFASPAMAQNPASWFFQPATSNNHAQKMLMQASWLRFLS